MADAHSPTMRLTLRSHASTRSLTSRIARLTPLGLALALVHCGASVSQGTGGGSDGGGTDGSVTDAAPAPDAQCTGTPTQPVARPACGVTSAPGFPADASSAPACTTVADCNDAGTDYGGYHACVAGKCSFDQCLADGDCPTGQACGCANEFGGNAIHFNQCIATQCRTSADCASGGACAPSSGSYCSSLTGFYCHSPADECANNLDCTCPAFSGTGTQAGQCVYVPQVGHFACQAVQICAG